MLGNEYAENDEDDQLSVDHRKGVIDNERSVAWMGSRNSGEKIKARGGRGRKKRPRVARDRWSEGS